VSNKDQISHVACCSTENIVSSKVIKTWVESKLTRNWVESYLRATLEVDGQEIPRRIVTAREAIAVRLKDLNGNSDHHAERHDMQTALAALTRIENEVSLCPPDVERAKRPPPPTPTPATDELKSGDRVEGLANSGRPTGEIGTVERANEDDAVVKWDDDGRVRVGQPWLKKV
jgi:hypothetical protein